jgi:precorrin-6B methylase 1
MIRRRHELAELEAQLAEARYQRDHGFVGFRDSHRQAVAHLKRAIHDRRRRVVIVRPTEPKR